MADAVRWAGATRAAQAAPARRPSERDVPAPPGAAVGAVRGLLRLEGLLLAAAALAAYARFGGSWGLFAAVFLLPDLALAGYLAGPRIGATAYNLAHAMAGPWTLVAIGVLGGVPLVLSLGLAWAAHVGLDRSLGFGLKYGSGFAHTHLGRLGRPDPW